MYAYNPFGDAGDDDMADEDLVARARAGEWGALEQLIGRHQAWVFNIAMRMVWKREDAEDATQEILLKMITKLGSFEGRSRFRTWLYRIAINHLLNVKKSAMERQQITFAEMGRELDETPDLELPDPHGVPVELPVLVEEARIGCLTAMLMCLDRRQRMAFTLGEIFGVTDQIGAELMELTPANFRQLLSRARRDLYSFMNDKCGLVNQANPCRCARKTQGFIARGYLDPQKRQFTEERTRQVRAVAPDRLKELDVLNERRHAALFRDHAFLLPPDQAAHLRLILDEAHTPQASTPTNARR